MRRKEAAQRERMEKTEGDWRENRQDTENKLIQDLQDQTKPEEVREDAARALGEFRIIDTVPSLRELLCNDNAAPSTRALAAKALGHIGDRKCIPQLRALLSNTDSDVRHRSVTALGRIGDLSVWRDIEQRLSDLKEPPKVRGAAATALGRLRAHGTIEALIVTLADDDDVLRSSAIKALGLIGDLTVRRFIEERLSDDNDDKNRSAAATALGLLGDREAVPALLAALQDETRPNVSGAILMALGHIGQTVGESKVRESIERWLSDLKQAPEVRGAAATALGLLGDREAVPALLAALQDETGPNVPGAILMALGARRSESRRFASPSSAGCPI
jgi:HEAT repeat protein